MRIVDDIILDPPAFAAGRTPLDLSGLGLEVFEARFGESTVEAAMIRQELGEEAVDPHLPNKEVILKLRVREDGEVDLATVAAQLQAKVGTLQREGGWMQRDFKVGGNFGSVVCQVKKKATLADFLGWQAGESPDVTLALLTGPLWYSTEEIESEVFVETSARELIWELDEVLGTAPGLIRVKVTNDNDDADFRGLISAIESVDHPQDETADTTAALAYEAEDLTPVGATEKTVSDASGGKLLRYTLGSGWLTLLSSEIDGVGHMTHVGARRLWVRTKQVGGEPGDVELRMQFRPLGALRWSDTHLTVPTSVADAFDLLDMGEGRAERATLGNQHWEWRLQGRRPGTGSKTIDIDRVYLFPTEQFVVVNAPEVTQGADFAEGAKSPGKVENVSGPGISPWDNPENAKASDANYATCDLKEWEFELFSPTSENLLAKTFGFALPEDATVVGIAVEVEKSCEGFVYGTSVTLLKGGATSGKSKDRFGDWPTTDEYETFGSESDLWGTTWTAAQINATNFGVLMWAQGDDGGVAKVNHVRMTVYYYEGLNPNKVCFAQSSVDLRTDGVFREHPELDDVWGRVIPDGFLPYAPPSGLEGRKARGIIVPTQGDLEQIADAGSNKQSVVVSYWPGYPFARDAAAG